MHRPGCQGNAPVVTERSTTSSEVGLYAQQVVSCGAASSPDLHEGVLQEPHLLRLRLRLVAVDGVEDVRELWWRRPGPTVGSPGLGEPRGAKVSHLSSSSLWPTVCVSSLGELRGGRGAVAHLIPLPLFGTPSLGVNRQGRGRGCARESPSLSRSELVRGQSRRRVVISVLPERY